MDDGEALYRRQKNQRLIYALFALFLLIAFGLYDSPLTAIKRETDLKVEPEYISGILSASGILFALWAFLIEKKPKERVAKHGYENIIFPSFFTSLGFLILSVILVFLTGLDLFSPAYTLGFCTLSFIMNTLLLALTLKYYKFTDSYE